MSRVTSTVTSAAPAARALSVASATIACSIATNASSRAEKFCGPAAKCAVNRPTPGLDTNPELVNSDPYGEGWMVEVRLADAASVDALLDADAYKALTQSA